MIVVCFLRASFSRRACVYLYLPKSMMRHTGGLASGATSTRFELLAARAVERGLDGHDAELLAVGADDADFADTDPVVDTDVFRLAQRRDSSQ